VTLDKYYFILYIDACFLNPFLKTTEFGSSKDDFFPSTIKKVSIVAPTDTKESNDVSKNISNEEESNEVASGIFQFLIPNITIFLTNIEYIGSNIIPEVPEESGNPDGRRRSSCRRRTLGSTASGQGQTTQVVAPLSRKDIFFQSSIGNLPEFQIRPSFQSYRRSILIKEDSDPTLPNLVQEDVQVVTDVSPTIPPKHSKCPILRCGTGSFRSSLSQMIDCSLLNNPIFIFIVGSNFFAMLGFYVPLVYISSAAMDKVNKQS
jgi:hypothetical protein